ncbi:hypothetical protein [Flavobacterium sp.]|uniref:hypothetical protein n=1 Tax=Flavobacterium sp. TaxID=239 RepID=UPI00260B3C5C|nr:hypothetical protein [Flavobacterium sp.]
MATTYETIAKEKIHALKFPNHEVLEDKDAIFQRNIDLNRAQSLGNLEHSKIKIFFEDNQSKKMVETTVWAVTDNLVVLKQGVGIPIHRIFKSF